MEKKDEVQRKTSRDKGKAPPPPIQPQPSSSNEKPPAPPVPVVIPNLPTPPSSPITPPETPPYSSPVHEPEENKDNVDNIKQVLEKQLQKRQSQGDLANDSVTVSASAALDDNLNNFVVVSPQTERNKLNTSTITINSDLPDPSNSLASNISQVS